MVESETRGLAALEPVVARAMAAHRTPGLALATVNREGVLWTMCRGWANLDAAISVTPQTRFQFGSIGKSFTAILVLNLVREGRLALHAPVTDYLPWFAVATRWGPITLHHLLSHSAGIIGGSDVSPDARYEVWALRHTTTGWEPGSAFHYSNVGYKTIGLILERVTGQPYADLVRERILAPLGMHRTAPVITHALRQDLAVGYQPRHDDEPFHGDNPLVVAPWIETDTADGCLSAPVGDLAAYARMLLNQGRTEDYTLLSPDLFELLIRPVVAVGPNQEYAYGLERREVGGHQLLTHSGGMLGYHAGLTVDLTAGVGAVAMANGPFPAEELTRYVVQANAGQGPLPQPTLWPGWQPEAAIVWSALAGRYVAMGRDGCYVELEWDGIGLVARDQQGIVGPLTAVSLTQFVSSHPRWRRFVLKVRQSPDGQVTLVHGPTVYNQGVPLSTPPIPPAWQSYCGHYRGYNPWQPTFRVVAREGALWLVWPHGSEYRLIPQEDDAGGFRCWDDGPLPETVRFDTVVDGQALACTFSGDRLYRFFTP